MAVSFINVHVNFQSSFSMLIINTGLRSKAVIFIKHFMRSSGPSWRPLSEANLSLITVNKSKKKRKSGTCDDMWRPE